MLKRIIRSHYNLQPLIIFCLVWTSLIFSCSELYINIRPSIPPKPYKMAWLRLINTQHAAPMAFPCHAVPLRVQNVSFPFDLHSVAVSDSHLPCHALTMPFFSRPWHSTAVKRQPVGYLPVFGFFRLPRGVPQRLLSEAYPSSSQRSIPMAVKSGSSTLQKRWSVKLLD